MSTTRKFSYFTRDGARLQTNKRLRDELLEKKSPKSKHRGSVRLISAPKE